MATVLPEASDKGLDREPVSLIGVSSDSEPMQVEERSAPTDHTPEDAREDSVAEPDSQAFLGPVTVIGKWADRVAIALFLVLVTIGTWNWVGDTDFTINLSEEDLQTLEELRALRNINVNEELPMTDTSQSRWIMDSGFEPPEADGTWISSRKAKIVFSSNDGEGISGLALGFFPFVADQVPSRALTIKTSLGETEVLLTGGGQAVNVPLDGESSQEIEINCDSIDAPVDLGVSPDVRTLCTKLLWVRADR